MKLGKKVWLWRAKRHLRKLEKFEGVLRGYVEETKTCTDPECASKLELEKMLKQTVEQIWEVRWQILDIES